jgi:hypothetical protein
VPRTRRSPLPLALTLVTLFAPCPRALAVECPPVRVLGTIVGEAGWRLGTALAGPGDLDGDGVPDIVVGAPGLGNGGAVLVYSGASRTEIRRYVGGPAAPLGEVVVAPGDIDNDGIGDILVGSPRAGEFPTLRRGLVRLYSGRDGSLIQEHPGRHSEGQFGFSATGIGDLDGDGWDDYGIGQPFREWRVSAYSGRTGRALQTVQPPNPFPLDFGYSMDRLGDIDGDGTPELLFGVPRGDASGRRFAGQVWIHRGLAATGAFHDIDGAVAFAQIGEAVAGLGDIDGDGVPDLSAGGRGHPVVNAYSGATGQVIHEMRGVPGTGFGTRLANAGDIDGDGVPDLLIGAPAAGGRVEVRSGRDGSILHAAVGAVGDRLGDALAGLGDFDGDGWDDFAVGAPLGDSGGQVDAGVVHLFGMPAPGLEIVMTARRALCRGDGTLVRLGVTNPGDFEIRLDVTRPGQGVVAAVLPAGTSLRIDLPETRPACDSGGAGTFDLGLRSAYSGCAGVLHDAASLPVLCEECESPNCPQRLAWWDVASRRRGADAPLQPAEWDALASCVDALSEALELGGSGEALRDVIRVRSDERISARLAEAEFTAVLANHCAGRLAAGFADPVRLHRATEIRHPDSTCDDLDCRIAELDRRLVDLRSYPAGPDRDLAYRSLRDDGLEINFGRRIGTVCGPGAASPTPFASASGPALSVRTNPVDIGQPLELAADGLPAGRVVVELFSIDGRRVSSLLEIDHSGGDLELIAPLVDRAGARLPAAIYFLRLQVGELIRSTKVLLLD